MAVYDIGLHVHYWGINASLLQMLVGLFMVYLGFSPHRVMCKLQIMIMTVCNSVLSNNLLLHYNE